jgi:hypothetical protein
MMAPPIETSVVHKCIRLVRFGEQTGAVVAHHGGDGGTWQVSLQTPEKYMPITTQRNDSLLVSVRVERKGVQWPLNSNAPGSGRWTGRTQNPGHRPNRCQHPFSALVNHTSSSSSSTQTSDKPARSRQNNTEAQASSAGARIRSAHYSAGGLSSCSCTTQQGLISVQSGTTT